MRIIGERQRGLVRPQLLAMLFAAAILAWPALTHVSRWILASSQSIVQPSRSFAALPPRILPATEGDGTHLAANSQNVDCTKVSCIALTFDDGPNPMTTPQVLANLEQAHVPATFFIVGSRVAGNESLLRQMHADGDEIGNHSWSHPDLTKLSDGQVAAQVEQTQAAIAAAGVPAPTVFRPPYGSVNPRVEKDINETILLWNEDPKDWAADTPAQVAQAVEASARPGGIIDMHDIYHVTANALPQIISDLSAQGYHFVTVDQLLNLTPSSRGIYYGHL